MFNIEGSNTTASTWNRRNQVHVSTSDAPSSIRIYTESADGPRGTLILQHHSRSELLHRLPALQNYIDPSTGDVLLPPAGPHCAINDDIVYDAIQAAVRPDSEQGFSLKVAEHPISYIQTHVVLVRLGLQNEARILQDRLWVLLCHMELSSETVSWIWETFRGAYSVREGEERSAYVPPFSKLYVEAMAWQIVGLRRMGKLDRRVEEYLRCDEQGFEEPCLRDVVDERERRCGVEMGWEMEGREPTTVGTGAEVEETLGIGKEDALPCQLSSQRMSTLDGVGRIKTSAAPAPKNSIQMSKQQPALHTPRPSLDLSRATSGYSASSFFDEKNVPAKNITSDDDEAEDDDEVLLKTPFREPGFHSRCGKTLGVGLGQGGLRGGNGWGELSQDFFSGAGTNGSNVGFGCGTPLDPKPNQNQTKTFGTTKQGTSTGTLFGPASSQVTGKFHPASLPPGIPSNTFDQAKKNTSGHFDTSTSNPSSGALFSHSGRISFFDAHTAMPSFSGTTFSSSFGAVPTFGTGSTLFGTPATTPYAPANSNSSNGDGALGSPMSIGSNTSTSIGASINAVQNNAFTASGAGMNPGIGFGFQSSGQSRGTEADLQQVFAEARSAAPARRVLKPKGMLGWRRK